MERAMVVGYGNPLRSDDGIAWQIIEHLRQELPTNTGVICVQQLTPELAADIALSSVVIFLDASSKGEPGTIHCEPVFARSHELRFSHHLTPSELLTLSDHLDSAKPRAFLISIHGERFDHGHSISSSVAHAVPEAVAQVWNLIKQLRRESESPQQLSATIGRHVL